MKKVYYLGSCSTCTRIMKSLDLDGVEQQDIKKDTMTPEQLDHMKELAGSYESLFSRRSMKYKSLGLKDKELTEKDYRNYILEEYTFLKRPVFVIDDDIFIGNAQKTVDQVAKRLQA